MDRYMIIRLWWSCEPINVTHFEENEQIWEMQISFQLPTLLQASFIAHPGAKKVRKPIRQSIKQSAIVYHR
jgi:hypothetical protein